MKEDFPIFETLFRDEFSKLVRHAARSGALDPQDAVQEAYEDLLGTAHSEIDKALLYTTVQRRAIDQYRALATRRGTETPVGLLPELEAIEADQLAHVEPYTYERHSFAGGFDAALRRLESDEQGAYILTELRGLTQREAADVLDMSQPTVHRRAEVARHTVRKEIAA
jgi:RNA polymerase sigma factor (sigma-70 family)